MKNAGVSEAEIRLETPAAFFGMRGSFRVQRKQSSRKAGV